MSYLKFHDADGDPIYVKNDILAVYTQVEKDTISSCLGPVGQVAKTSEPLRVVISQDHGQWEVTESYEEILDQISEAEPCE